MPTSIFNHTRGVYLARNCIIVDSFFGRLFGLLGKKGLAIDEGLIILPCNSVHTVGMRFSIDVLFLNKDGFVTKVLTSVRPYRFSSIVCDARCAVELPIGVIKKTNTKVGDLIFF